MKAPVHYGHNGLHGGSHSDGMSTVGPFCVVHTYPSQAPPSPPLSPGCQGVSSLRAHSQPVPRGGTPQPRQGVLCEEMYTSGVPDHPPLHAVGW